MHMQIKREISSFKNRTALRIMNAFLLIILPFNAFSLVTNRISTQNMLENAKSEINAIAAGAPGVIDQEDDALFYQKALHRVRFTDGSNPLFYMYYLWYAAQTGQLKPYYTGTGIKHLTGQSLVKVPVPTAGKEIQNNTVTEIESRLSVCDSIEQTVDLFLFSFRQCENVNR